MKLLYITDAGAETQALQLAQMAQLAGHRVSVLTQGGVKRGAAVIGTVPVHAQARPEPVEIERILDGERPDTLHLVRVSGAAAWLSAARARALPVAVTLCAGDELPDGIDGAVLVAAMDEASRLDIMKKRHIPLRLIPHGQISIEEETFAYLAALLKAMER